MFSIFYEGYCPQCLLEDQKIELVLNDIDQFECPQCHLQVNLSSPLYAMICTYRTKGRLKSNGPKATEHTGGRGFCEQEGHWTGEIILEEEELRRYIGKIVDKDAITPKPEE